ncbi:hypothetical protein CEP52_005929 [Fusarium oligoseptatum]|uniref:Uncharacterized protein n=1 Tax=Fusarium oligoseptatum TaxID=2604345 RepID=A0A428TVI3_9HYPO|nr:hypothetical protein CEP52_005929 [Fusarium oligoseptatum]
MTRVACSERNTSWFAVRFVRNLQRDVQAELIPCSIHKTITRLLYYSSFRQVFIPDLPPLFLFSLPPPQHHPASHILYYNRYFLDLKLLRRPRGYDTGQTTVLELILISSPLAFGSG